MSKNSTVVIVCTWFSSILLYVASWLYCGKHYTFTLLTYRKTKTKVWRYQVKNVFRKWNLKNY